MRPPLTQGKRYGVEDGDADGRALPDGVAAPPDGGADDGAFELEGCCALPLMWKRTLISSDTIFS